MISEREFRGLYEQYEKLVRATVFYLAAPNELDEIVQEVFLKIWGGAHEFKNRSTLSTWIYRVSYNAAIDALRKKSKEVEAEEKAESSFENKIIDQDFMRKALTQLSESDQEILKLYYYVELQIDEISQMLNLPDGTVKSRLHNAKERLRSILKESGVFHE